MKIANLSKTYTVSTDGNKINYHEREVYRTGKQNNTKFGNGVARKAL